MNQYRVTLDFEAVDEDHAENFAFAVEKVAQTDYPAYNAQATRLEKATSYFSLVKALSKAGEVA